MKRFAVLAVLLCLLLAVPGFAATTGYYDGEGFSFQIPDGWDETQSAGLALLTPPEYPTNASNITISVSDKDADFDSYAQSDFLDLYRSLFDSVTPERFERTVIAGAPAIVFSYGLEMSGVEMHQVQYLLDLPDASLALTFTEVDGYTLSVEELLVISTLRIDGLEGGTTSPGAIGGYTTSRLAKKILSRIEKRSLL